MHQIHLKECTSTQEEVKRLLKENPGDYLISTDSQVAGIGRQGSQWIHFEDALAFSFTLKANEELTLTPLEIGCLLAIYFKPKVHLKWPNDLLDKDGAKIGGILCQIVNDRIVVGIGLNLKNKKEESHFPYPVSSLFDEHEVLDINIKESLPIKIVDFILKNRQSPSLVRENFLNNCVHKNKEVTITNNDRVDSGTFIGIGQKGEALIEDKGSTQKVLTGSLRFS